MDFGKLIEKHLFRSLFFSKRHCVESLRIKSYSGPYFPAYEINTERYGVSLRIQSECGKIRTRKTPNTDTFNAVRLWSGNFVKEKTSTHDSF